MAGLIVFSDTIEPDAQATIDFMEANGIDVKMVTGDNRSIAQEVSRELGFTGSIIEKNDLGKMVWSSGTPEWWKGVSGFSEVLPEDKYHIVEEAKKYFTVASTGDGVNDLAALQMANVGIAVSRAVDALKANADIVLTSAGHFRHQRRHPRKPEDIRPSLYVFALPNIGKPSPHHHCGRARSRRRRISPDPAPAHPARALE